MAAKKKKKDKLIKTRQTWGNVRPVQKPHSTKHGERGYSRKDEDQAIAEQAADSGTQDHANDPIPVRIMQNHKLWVEGEAERQFRRVAAQGEVVIAVGMPDLHPGKGCPVGAVFALQDAVWPELMGEDIGCGMRVYKTDLQLHKLKLEKFANEIHDRFMAQERPSGLVFRDIWQQGARGIRSPEIQPFLQESSEAEDAQNPVVSTPPREWDSLVSTLGTVGGGNHFIELLAVDELLDPESASDIGLGKHDVLVAIHTGSRRVGSAVWEHTMQNLGKGILPLEKVPGYMGLMRGALNCADANRALLASRLANSIRKAKWTYLLDKSHNYVAWETWGETETLVHRKGAVRADANETFFLPGSRGDYSYLMQGTGNAEWLASVAHGAGRKMSRQEAADKMEHKYKRDELYRTKLGSHVVCDESKLLYQEAPEAYKPVDSVRQCMEEHDAAKTVARLRPLVTIKC